MGRNNSSGSVKRKEVHDMSRDASALREQLETDTLANRLRYHLGLKYDEDSGEWKERRYNKLNREGVEKVVGTVRGIVDKNQTTSQFHEKEIQNLMTRLHRAVAREIAENWRNYEISSIGEADGIVETVTNICYAAFKRAQGGKTLETIGDTTKTVSKTETGRQEESRDGFLPF